MNNFEKYFPLPFTSDGIYIWSSKGSMVAMGLQDHEEILLGVTKVINDNSCRLRVRHKPGPNSATYNEKDQVVSIHGTPVLMIRGWGHLTAASSHNLTDKEAVAIQDELGNWIAKQLNRE